MKCERVVFSGHAIQRMFQRSPGRDEVVAVVSSGEIVADYPDDSPYPSRLLLGFVDSRPVHVVVACEAETGMCIVVTAYEPQPEQVTVSLQRGDTTVILKQVPADVCENCGEYYLSDTVTAQVLERTETAVKSGAEVEILKFAA